MILLAGSEIEGYTIVKCQSFKYVYTNTSMWDRSKIQVPKSISGNTTLADIVAIG